MSNVERIDRLATQPQSLTTSSARGEQSGTLAVDETDGLPSETSEARRAGRALPQSRRSTRPKPSGSEEAPRFFRRPSVRWALFALLPLALIAGGYWYVTGGQVMSTDDAYVEADKVGISTDVSGHRARKSMSPRTSTSKPDRFCTGSIPANSRSPSRTRRPTSRRRR